MNDFLSLPLGLPEPTERIQRLAKLIWDVLVKHKDLPVLPATQEEVLALVRRVETHRIPIIRKSHKGALAL